jgi:hypothetical protein
MEQTLKIFQIYQDNSLIEIYNKLVMKLYFYFSILNRNYKILQAPPHLKVEGNQIILTKIQKFPLFKNLI